MSWALFKSNILKYSNNPNSLPDLESVAKLWTNEYDAAVKRGYDTVNFAKVKKGNTKLMEELVLGLSGILSLELLACPRLHTLSHT